MASRTSKKGRFIIYVSKQGGSIYCKWVTTAYSRRPHPPSTRLLMVGYITSGLCSGLLLSSPLQPPQTCTTGRTSLQRTKRHTPRHHHTAPLPSDLLHASGHHRQATPLEVFGTDGRAHTAGLPVRLRPSLLSCRCQTAEKTSGSLIPKRARIAGCIHPRLRVGGSLQTRYSQLLFDAQHMHARHLLCSRARRGHR